MTELIDFANMFLITNGLFFAALGATETHNEKLKVGLSIGGLLISISWIVCTTDVTLSSELTPKVFILKYIPCAFIAGWLLSLCIHGYNWYTESNE